MLSYTLKVTRGRFFSNWGKHPSPISPGYRESQLLEAGEPTVFIARRGAGGLSTSLAGVSLANCTTASARVVTTSFAPESRRR